ncbi:MAG: hypothetical protein CM15mP64_8250 [Candidatus Neomarinimicrobiota bacterium]|nr:MAG: hypothetical protein CM15mP64_8250 [Candidatus Neomarinimicrobiota bacterium]
MYWTCEMKDMSFTDTGRSEYTFINRSLQETDGFKAHYGEPGVHTWEEYFT